MFLFVALALLVVLPSPWNALGFVACLLLFGGEVVYWNRTVRGRRASAGAETLVGQTGSVVTACLLKVRCVSRARSGKRVARREPSEARRSW